MRVVIDSNVFVSATLSEKSAPAEIIKAWIRGEYEIIISQEILEELRRVLFKPQIRAYSVWTEEEVREFLKSLEELSVKVPGNLKLRVIKEDPTDDKFIIAAIEGEADYIVSGDAHLRKLGSYKSIKIVAPAQFVKIISPVDNSR